MNRCEEWKFFIEQLQEKALADYHSTREYELRKMRQEYPDDMMSNELTENQRTFIEEILYEIISLHDREADLLYQQGLKDSVWMLRTLGVLV